MGSSASCFSKRNAAVYCEDKSALVEKGPLISSSPEVTTDLAVQSAARVVTDFYSINNDKTLGSSTWGDVVVCTHKINKGQFALKTVHKDAMSAKQLDALKLKITQLVTLEHPNRVRVYEYFETADALQVVVELCSGGDLLHKLNKQPNKCFSEEVTRRYIRQILSAVAHGHKQGIVHEYLKLANCMFKDDSEDAEVKLAGQFLASSFSHTFICFLKGS
jgi:serine/threonine protein kinase